MKIPPTKKLFLRTVGRVRACAGRLLRVAVHANPLRELVQQQLRAAHVGWRLEGLYERRVAAARREVLELVQVVLRVERVGLVVVKEAVELRLGDHYWARGRESAKKSKLEKRR